MQKQSDEQLVAAYFKGDEAALEILIKRYLEPIYGFVFRYARDSQVAEDLTQEVFLRVWRNLKKFDQKKNFKVWVYAIAKNAALDFLKKKKSIPFSELDSEEENFADKIADKSLLPDKSAELADIGNSLAGAMQKLSEKYRQVLSLYYNDYLNFREIAQLLGEPLNTVKSRHRRGLALLRDIVSDR